MDPTSELRSLQAGVIARRQAQEMGLSPHDVARRLRRRDWVALLPGVYVDHTGEPIWLQRAWAGVLFSWPAALSGASALRAADGPGRRDADERIITVAIDASRRDVAPTGVRVVRTRGLACRVNWNLGPPRIRYDEAALDVALAATSDFAAIGVLAQAIQSRRTTAERIGIALADRSRAPRRDWLTTVLADLADGESSVLEHAYAVRVEKPHGLPVGQRQQRQHSRQGVVYRDVAYACGVLVELDGRLFHDTATQRDRDFDRDLAAATDGRTTIRLSWGQVVDRPCRTARQLAAVLTIRGWTGVMQACPECP